MLTEGLKALSDYISILEFFREDSPESTFELETAKAAKYMSQIKCLQKDTEMGRRQRYQKPEAIVKDYF